MGYAREQANGATQGNCKWSLKTGERFRRPKRRLAGAAVGGAGQLKNFDTKDGRLLNNNYIRLVSLNSGNRSFAIELLVDEYATMLFHELNAVLFRLETQVIHHIC